MLEHKTTTVYRSDGTEKVTTQVRVTPKGLARLTEAQRDRLDIALVSAIAQARREALEEAGRAIEDLSPHLDDDDDTFSTGISYAGATIRALIEKETK